MYCIFRLPVTLLNCLYSYVLLYPERGLQENKILKKILTSLLFAPQAEKPTSAMLVVPSDQGQKEQQTSAASMTDPPLAQQTAASLTDPAVTATDAQTDKKSKGFCKQSAEEAAEETEKVTEKEKAESCAICFNAMPVDATLKENMDCGHEFCRPCIRDWHRRSQSCPVCRFAPNGANVQSEDSDGSFVFGAAVITVPLPLALLMMRRPNIPAPILASLLQLHKHNEN